jgi:hypothetical protein
VVGRGAACVKELAWHSFGKRLTTLRKTKIDLSKLGDIWVKNQSQDLLNPKK